MKVPEKYYCDICGKEISVRECIRHIFVKTNCSWTDGSPDKEHIEEIAVDICDECLLKGTNFTADCRAKHITIDTHDDNKNAHSFGEAASICR